MASRHDYPDNAGWTADEKARREMVEAGGTVIANISADKHLIQWAKDSGLFVYIGRRGRGRPASKWQNPEPMKQKTQAERDRVCD